MECLITNKKIYLLINVTKLEESYYCILVLEFEF